ncbi:MAG: hypothetical protein ETSY2_10265 [Candidatus Entotheonella gemina]|uniref:DUF2341 domain-containing protein n=1 Tax=Candidatus Entotheonella gemina TaxID=1429439 RepID=W4MD85_9BACT|nr:MAG: hypothetical protein ETSY2_10265 [Candidatus Entotheonella gemina]
MKWRQWIVTVLILLTLHATAHGRNGSHPADASQRITAAYLALPLAFEANQGQVRHPSVDFLTRGSGYTVFFTHGHATLILHAAEPAQVLRLNLVGAHANPEGMGRRPLAHRSHYLLGRDPTAWQTHIENYRAITYAQVYPGIDLHYYGNQGQLEYDFTIAAGAAPERIRMAFDGATSIAIANNGNLMLTLPNHETVRFKAPLAYQEQGGQRQIIASRYHIAANGEVGFKLDAYDTGRPLIIDPILDYTTYLGGSLGSDPAYDIAIDPSGHAYITGSTNSADFPGTPVQAGTGIDTFVTKLSPDGTSAIYSTYFGGNSSETQSSIALDATGRAYIAGSTQSSDFPTTTGAFDEGHNDGSDAFVAVLSAAGDALQYATYIGGQGVNDSGRAIAVDSTGKIYVAGSTDSANTGGAPDKQFPTTAGAYDTTWGGNFDAFVVKLDPSGNGVSDLLYATYLGGATGNETANDILVAGQDDVYITGHTISSDFPVITATFGSGNGSNSDAYVARLHLAGAGAADLAASARLGSNAFATSDTGQAIAMDAAGNIYVAGYTDASSFPTTPGAYDETKSTSDDGFIAKLNGNLSALNYSTFLGGNGIDQIITIAVDANGQAHVGGFTFPSNLPVTADALDSGLDGMSDGFLATLDAGGANLTYLTYFGGTNNDIVYRLVADSSGTIYTAGSTGAPNLSYVPSPAVLGSSGLTDAFAAKFVPADAAWYDNAWQYRKRLTMDSALVDANQADFSLLVYLASDAELAAAARADGFDILFTDDDGTTQLDHDIETYVSATGELAAWVRIPALPATFHKHIYLYYGHPNASDQRNRAGARDAKHIAVWHLNESPANGVAGHDDATGNANDATPQGFDGIASSTTNGTGKISGGNTFDGVDDTVTIPDNATWTLSPLGDYTWQMWINPDDLSSAFTQLWGQTNASTRGVGIYAHTTTNSNLGPVTNGISVDWNESGADKLGVHSTNNVLMAGTWHHVAITYDSSLAQASRVTIYVDGMDVTDRSDINSTGTLSGVDPVSIAIGGNPIDVPTWFDGHIDEASVSGGVRSTEWIAAQYHNQNLPASFVTVSTEAEIPGLIVRTTADVVDGDTSSIDALLADRGADSVISLREAITAANNTANGDAPDEISFNIPDSDANHVYYRDDGIIGSLSLIATATLSDDAIGDFDPDYPNTQHSWFRIEPGSPLPVISDPVIIDGYTQPGAQANTVAAPGLPDAVLKIELDGSGAGAAANGLNLMARDIVIRGLIINQFDGDGLKLQGLSSTSNTITGNYIGTDASGTRDLGNAQHGVHVLSGASVNVLGGTTAGSRNIISGNDNVGVNIVGTSTAATRVEGNFIGTDMTGMAPLGNTVEGIVIGNSAINTVIGGSVSGAGNLISANLGDGVSMWGNSTTGTTFQGNYIGTDITGAVAAGMGNQDEGVDIQFDASDNSIGSFAATGFNRIAGNGSHGIEIVSGIANFILGNEIYANGGLGIQLSGGTEDAFLVTANDTGDADTGPNHLQNYPVLQSVQTTGSAVRIRGTLNSTVASTFIIFYFASAAADASGHGEAERYLGLEIVLTDPITGDASFTFVENTPVAAGEVVTATATEIGNHTSEFALSVAAMAEADSDGDGVFDSEEDRNVDGDGNPTTGPPLNTDGDGMLDHLDTDDDGDGTLTANEDANGNGDPTDDDTDGDGIPDYLDPADDGPGPGDSDGDGVTDDQECPSSPPCTDTDSDGIPNYNDPDHNTLVEQLVAEAQVSEDGVSLRLSTGWEHNHLGYHIYRGSETLRHRLTSALLPGSVLLAGANSVLSAGHRYEWFDPAGTPDDLYWLLEVDIHGHETWHGPIRPVPESIPAVPLATPLLRARSARSHLTHTPSGQPPGNYAKVTVPSTPPVWEQEMLTPQALQWALAQAPAIQLLVRQPGWYRVPQAALIEAGLDPAIDPRLLQLFADGVPHPVYVSGENDARLDANDWLAFYGKGLDTPWTDTRIYWLAAGTQPGRRVPQNTFSPASPAPTHFPYTLTWHERHLYAAAIRNGEAENFFGAIINSEPYRQDLLLDHLVAPSFAPPNAELEIALHGVSTGEHHVSVHLNGHTVGTMAFTGQNADLTTFSVPYNWLLNGVNRIELQARQEPLDISLLDTIRLTYAHAYQATGDVLFATAPAGQQVTIRGFTQPGIHVFDITEPQAVEALRGDIIAHGEGYAITVTPTGEHRRMLLAITEPRIRRPAAVRAHQPSAWHRPGQGADMVMIAPWPMLESLVPLYTLRERQGLQVSTIAVDDLYNEFTFGEKHPLALKRFLRHAVAHWQPAPRFVLLVGDGHFDPRQYLGGEAMDWLPVYSVDTESLETVSDDWYVDLNDDTYPDLAVGRLPVNDIAEADAVVAKLVAHAASSGVWEHRALVVTDTPDAFDFAAAMEPLVQELSTAFEVARLPLGTLALDEARRQLRDQLETGQGLVTFLGHGALDRWSAEGLLSTSSIEAVRNEDRLPMVVSLTCLNGFFHDSRTMSLAEAMLVFPNGAVAVWASSGLTRAADQLDMHRAFITSLLHEPRLTIGESILQAKQRVRNLDTRRTWQLFGDPAMRLD